MKIEAIQPLAGGACTHISFALALMLLDTAMDYRASLIFGTVLYCALPITRQTVPTCCHHVRPGRFTLSVHFKIRFTHLLSLRDCGESVWHVARNDKFLTENIIARF